MTPPGRPPTPLFRLYGVAASLLVPLAWAVVSRKLRRHGVAPERCRERLGNASIDRPAGPLIWFHAASVGESLSILTLIARMADRLPQTCFLITSGTATSAELIGKRLPPRTTHQFAPLDAAGPVKRFLKHWRPRAGVFVESELWPTMLVRARAAEARLALLNARLSEKSVQGWRRFPDTAQFILDQFAVILTQNAKTADNLLSMGADPDRVQTGSNLKSTSAPLPIDTETLETVRRDLDGRPVWVASSTHPGEEAVVLAAHRALQADLPELCLLLVPRHPERGDEVEALITATGMSVARRSRDEPVTAKTDVYLADTLGETGTWYALTPIVFLGGSLEPIGGHNPFEPAQAGAAVITGPHVTNFAETFTPLAALGGAVEVESDSQLARAVQHWLQDPDSLEVARTAAGDFARDRAAALQTVIDSLCETLELDDE